jgi:hypothetical protein
MVHHPLWWTTFASPFFQTFLQPTPPKQKKLKKSVQKTTNWFKLSSTQILIMQQMGSN